MSDSFSGSLPAVPVDGPMLKVFQITVEAYKGRRGFAPSDGVGLIVFILVILFLMGRI